MRVAVVGFASCIGFTATIPSGKEGEVVQDRLSRLKVMIWDNFGYKDEDREPDRVVASFEDFFETSTRGAKLVHCKDDEITKVAELAAKYGFKYDVECDKLSTIRDMSGWCLI